MRLTPKLLGLLNRVWERDPLPFVALRVRYAGGLTWTVSDGVLTLTTAGGVGASVSYVLADYTLTTLAQNIASRAGFEVAFLDAERAKLNARVLLDGAGDQDASNGDHLLGYTSLTWAFFEAFADHLQTVADQIGNMLRQMSTTSAEGEWLDLIGSYYKVVREVGEVDAIYGQRIITETLRPLSNNVAIERAIADFTAQPCTVDDVVIYGDVQKYDASVNFDGSVNFDAVTPPRYGLFDITVGYDLIAGGDITSFLDQVRAIVGRLRAAGTHMRALVLSSAGAPLNDDFTAAPTDSASIWSLSLAAMTDALTAPTEAVSGWVAQLGDIVDALTPPTDSADGGILAVLTTETGAPITDENGDPILVPVAPLFV